MKSIVLSIFIMTIFMGNAQTNLNEYKYIVVPKRFDGFKKENQFRTSTLIKHLFAQKGFTAIYDDALPNELNSNRCLALYVVLRENSSLFATKTRIVLKDCAGLEVFVTDEGKSKEKDFTAAYSEAINRAFNSFDNIEYSYSPKEKEEISAPITVSFKNDIKKLEETKPVASDVKEAMIEQKATTETQSYKDRNPVPSTIKKAEEQEIETMNAVTAEEVAAPSSVDIKNMGVTLYAQEIPNGFQLVDNTPKIRLKIFKSSVPDVYTAKTDTTSGVVYAKDGKWFFEYYEGENLVVEELNIKF